MIKQKEEEEKEDDRLPKFDQWCFRIIFKKCKHIEAMLNMHSMQVILPKPFCYIRMLL